MKTNERHVRQQIVTEERERERERERQCTNRSRQDCDQVPSGSHGTLDCDAADSSWHECRSMSSLAQLSSLQAALPAALSCRI